MTAPERTCGDDAVADGVAAATDGEGAVVGVTGMSARGVERGGSGRAVTQGRRRRADGGPRGKRAGVRTRYERGRGDGPDVARVATASSSKTRRGPPSASAAGPSSTPWSAGGRDPIA